MSWAGIEDAMYGFPFERSVLEARAFGAGGDRFLRLAPAAEPPSGCRPDSARGRARPAPPPAAARSHSEAAAPQAAGAKEWFMAPTVSCGHGKGTLEDPWCIQD